MAFREDAKITKFATNALTFNGKELAALATLTPAAGGSNVCNVTIQLKTGMGKALANANVVDVWLSDAATGLGITGTAASGTPAPTTGTILGILTAKKAWRVASSATGGIVLEITDTAKTGFYVAVAVNGAIVGVSAQLVAANYG